MLEHAGVSVRLVRPVIAGLHACGIDPAPALLEAGIDPAVLLDADGRVPHHAALEMWNQAVSLTRDANFGLHAAEGVDVATLDVQSYAVLSSPTLRDGLQRASRLHRLNHEAATVGLFDEQGGAAWRHELPGGAVLPRHPAEFVLLVTLCVARLATGTHLIPAAVRFAHPKPADLGEHKRLFGVTPQFGTGQNAIVFTEDSLALPCVKADPHLLQVLERHAKDLLERLPKSDTLPAKVQALLAAELHGGNPSAEQAASRLGMSVRTLSRRLAEHGTSHQALLDSLRQELCKNY